MASLGAAACEPEEDNRLLEPLLEWTTCVVDEDCVNISTECCDVCNGGRLVRVNRAFEQAARDAMVDTNCDGVACTMVGCIYAQAICNDGLCDLP